MSQIGKVALVGAGPGDEGLLTVRGMELLREADCVVFDRLLNKKFIGLTKENCEKIYVGKENHHHTLAQQDINELLLQKAKEYQLVVRLKGGDPYVFGRGGEEALFLNANGVEVEVVPGVSSAVAAAAMAGIPLTHRGLAKGFMVITAHNQKDKISEIDYSLLTDADITLVFLMGLAHVKEIAEGLIKAGRNADTSACVISCGTTPNQKKCVGTLENIAELTQKAQLGSPSIIVVGKVVSLSEELSFFEKRPLFGKSFFLPVIEKFEYPGSALGSFNELEKELTQKGAEVITATTGRITPLEINLDFLDEAQKDDYIVFTSASGVNAFFYNLLNSDKRDIRSLPNCRFAVIGDKTKAALNRFGIRADEVSDTATAKDFAAQISQNAKDGADIYWLCGKRHSADFEAEIVQNHPIHKIICYENVPVESAISEEELEKIAHCDGIILTCGSNARFACKALKELPGTVYSIGPACTESLRKYGVTGITEALESSYDGLLKLVLGS